MNKAVNSITDFILGKPEQRFQDVTANLENIQSEINLTDDKIKALLTNGNPKLSPEDVQKQIAELKLEKAELNKKFIEKRDQLKNVQREYKTRKIEDYKDQVKTNQEAYVQSTGQEAKKTAQALASAKIAVRKARLISRNRNRIGGKRKSQKKRRTSKRK